MKHIRYTIALYLIVCDSSTSAYIACHQQIFTTYIQIFTTNKHLPWNFYHDIRKNDDYKKNEKYPPLRILVLIFDQDSLRKITFTLTK